MENQGGRLLAMMKKTVLLMLAAGFWGCIYSAGYCAANQKIGVLVIGAGMNETYKPDWIVGYTDHFFPIFTPGMLTGGQLEGGTCFSLIHYANEAEATVCSQVSGKHISQGTPIDIFCKEYTNLERYPVHSISEHRLFGKNGFFADCYPGVLPYFIASGHSTIDPSTGKEILGPHVDDPDGPGIGFADFEEQYAFTYMDYHYRLTDFIDPSRRQFLRFIYGNAAPALYGYEPDAPELSNIKDAVEKSIDSQTTIVFRNGWESYMRNRDAYKKASAIPDSTETALKELIEDEKVDRLIVLSNGAHYSNIITFGYCWRDAGAAGVSRVDNATYYDCITDVSDGYGPENDRDLNTLLAKKPWRNFLAAFPEVYHMARERAPGLQITFARPFGDYPAFTEAVVEMFKHTVARYQISSEKKVKVILAFHGYSSGYMKGAQCDAYSNMENSLAARAVARVESYLKDSWSGRHEVVSAVNEFSEPFLEDTNADPPSRGKPMGSIMSTGEHIDSAINGVYVNGLGQVIDNGIDNFDYVIAIPVLWDAENVDTIQSFRELTLGNHALQSAAGSKKWFRQTHSEDGDDYRIDTDFDSEYFTVKVMDASGWGSTPARTSLLRKPVPVKKGSAQKPTTVILAGTVLSQGNGPARSYVIQAAAASILEAIDDHSVGGYHDEACEMRALNAVVGLTAEPRSGSVQLTWMTAGEAGSIGFNIYRAETAAGPFVKLNEAPIASSGSSSVELQYVYRDAPLKSRTMYYYQIEHEFSGGSASFGPVSATPRPVWFPGK